MPMLEGEPDRFRTPVDLKGDTPVRRRLHDLGPPDRRAPQPMRQRPRGRHQYAKVARVDALQLT